MKLPAVLLIATGSEVALCVKAHEMLKQEGIDSRVISMPSWELFEKQSHQYKNEVLPPEITARVTVEQASKFGWERYAGPTGEIIGVETFGASAPLAELKKKFGFCVEDVVAAAQRQVKLAKGLKPARNKR